MNLDSSSQVALTTCSSYEQAELMNAMSRALAALDLPLTLRSAKVLLKPNLISAKHGRLACTEGAFILATARWLLDHGAKVSVGDSPAFGTAVAALQALGIADELAVLGVRIKNFSRGREVKLPGGGKAVLAAEALDCDLLFNLPRVKAHAQTRLTLALKNYFGCLVGLHKAWWHMAFGGKGGGFNSRLVRIPLALPDSVSLVDGIIAMHRTGPILGESYPLSLLAASTNPVAMDRALHEVLAVSPRQSPLMSACRDAALPGTHLPRLSFPLLTPQEVKVNDFLVPNALNPIRFNPLRFLTSSIRRILMT